MNRRIVNEVLEMPKVLPKSCAVWLKDENTLRGLTASIVGSDNTPYEGGIFFLNISLSSAYPFREPHVVFITKIYHPNVHNSGEMRLRILKREWSPLLNISKVILSVIDLMINIDLSDPLEYDIARLYKNDREKFEAIAREWTNKYAI